MKRVGVLAAGAVVLVGCGTAEGQPTDLPRTQVSVESPGRPAARLSDDQEIVRVLEMARSALVRNQGAAVCDLLTAHGRTRALGFQVDFAEEGTAVPSKDPRLPQTCEAVVEREWSEARSSWLGDLRHVRFSVRSIHGTTAKAQLKVQGTYGPVIPFTLRKTSRGWRIDDSTAVPSGY